MSSCSEHNLKQANKRAAVLKEVWSGSDTGLVA